MAPPPTSRAAVGPRAPRSPGAMLKSELKASYQRLVRALAVLADPQAPEEQRRGALRAHEAFLVESVPCVVHCGLKLVEASQPASFRCYGVDILEHVVEACWDATPAQQRELVKGCAMSLVSAPPPGPEGFAHARDLLTRVLLKVIKLEWPERWPKLLPRLAAFARKGAAPAELVMLILTKEVLDLEALNGGRKRHYVRPVWDTVCYVLRHYGGLRCRLTGDPVHAAEVQACGRLLTTALDSMASYTDRFTAMLLFRNETNSLRSLWALLGDSELRLKTCECLIAAVRHAHNDVLLLNLFADCFPLYLSPVKTAGGVLTEQQYAFTKKQCELLCSIGRQHLRADNLSLTNAVHFQTYLEHLLDFTSHSSQSISFITQSVWKDFFSHDVLSCDSQLLAMIPKYLCAASKNLMKLYYASHAACPYSHFEFSGDEDFKQFLVAFRDEQRQILELVCSLDHVASFQIASDCLKSHLSDPSNTEPVKFLTRDGLTNPSDRSFLQWKSVTFFIKTIIHHMFQKHTQEAIPMKNGIELIQLVVNFKTNDPQILACLQEIIATLIPFLNFQKEIVPEVFAKVLDFMEQIKAPKVRALKSARIYACYSILNMCKDNAHIMPGNKFLYTRVKQLLCNEQQPLTPLEKGTLMEAMVLLINQLKDYERQKALLEKLIEPAASFLQSKEMQKALSNSEAFIRYVGAGLENADAAMEHPTDLNRSRLIACMSTIQGVLRRTSCPTDLEEAKAGGFVIEFMPSGTPLYRNPCAEQVLKLMNSFLLLIRIQHDLYLPDVVKKMSDTFNNALNIPQVTNDNPLLHFPESLLDAYDHSGYKTKQQELQGFFCNLYQTCFCIVGHAVSLMKHDLSSMRDLLDQLLKSAFVNLETIPCYRIFVILRVFLKPLVRTWSPEYHEPFLFPIVGALLPTLYKRLSHEWEIIEQRKTKESTDTITASQNMVDKQVMLLTGEVTEFIIACCLPKEETDIGDVACFVSNDEASLHDTAVKSGVTYSLLQKTANTYVVTTKSSEIKEENTAVDARCDPFKTMLMSTVMESSKETKELRCVSNEDENNTVCTAESDDEGSASEDATVVNAESDNALFELNADTIVVPAISTDAIFETNQKAVSSVAASVPSVPCNLSCENEANSAITAESDCCVSIEDADISVADAPESDDACVPVNKNAANNVAAESSDVCSMLPENADTSDAFTDSDNSDGEMAVEKPQPCVTSTKLTALGVCLMKEKDVQFALLVTAFSSLRWNNSLISYKKATHLCWLLLEQGILEAPCADIVTYCFTLVLKGLEGCAGDRFSRDALLLLAFQIYVSLRHCYTGLNKVLKQFARVKHFYLARFDNLILGPTNVKPHFWNTMRYFFVGLLRSSGKASLGEKMADFIEADGRRRRKRLEYPLNGPPLKKQKHFQVAPNQPLLLTDDKLL